MKRQVRPSILSQTDSLLALCHLCEVMVIVRGQAHLPVLQFLAHKQQSFSFDVPLHINFSLYHASSQFARF